MNKKIRALRNLAFDVSTEQLADGGSYELSQFQKLSLRALLELAFLRRRPNVEGQVDVAQVVPRVFIKPRTA